MSAFVFGGKSTAELGVVIERFPAQQASARRITSYAVPGRNGLLHVDEGVYEEIPKNYEVYFRGQRPMPEMAHAVKNWLRSAGVGARLEDTYDPQHFFFATFQGPMDMENIWNRYGRCVITFTADPRAFRKTGEISLDIPGPMELLNPTENPAQPLITVFGNAPGTVTVGGVTVTVKELTSPIVLDCEAMNAYSQPGEGAPVNKNNAICAIPFPVLKPGLNYVTFDGGIERLEIIPRWWD